MTEQHVAVDHGLHLKELHSEPISQGLQWATFGVCWSKVARWRK